MGMAAVLSTLSCSEAGLTSSSLSVADDLSAQDADGEVVGNLAIVSGGGPFHVSGPRGGPFPSGSRTYRLVNNGPTPLEWDLEASVPWLLPTPAGGILAPGAQTMATVQMDNAFANGLPVGEYPADLIFTDTDGTASVHLAFLLSVLDLTVHGELEVSPEDGLALEIEQGQDSGLPQSMFTISNVGDGPLEWAASASEPWLVLGTADDNLAVEQSQQVGLSLDPFQASQLAQGSYTASIVVVNSNLPGMSTELPILLTVTAEGDDGRVGDGLIAEYLFEEAGGTIVRDVSGQVPALDLSIDNPSAVSWGAGTISIQSPTTLVTSGPATRLIDSIRASGEMTVEAWIVPDNLNQQGPARLVSVSNGATLRNFTLGQGLFNGLPTDTFNMRTRHTGTNLDGEPMLATPAGSAHLGLQHVVYTRTPGGNAVLYVDGTVQSTADLGGNFSNWDSGYRLALANEIGASRPWLGSMHLVAIYDRALSNQEVQQNFQAGSGASNVGHLAVTPNSEMLFSAQEGLPPTVLSRVAEITNIGGEQLNWTLSESAPWLTVSQSQGALAPGASASVNVNLMVDSVTSLPVGIYTTELAFTNQTTGFGNTTRNVRLVITEEGSSGANGEKPGPNNTGPSDPGALTTVGSMTVTEAGTVIENVHIQGTLSIKAPNVTVRNFIVDGGGNVPYGIRATDDHSGLLMEDGEILNITSSGLYGGDFTARRLNIHDSGGDAIKATKNVLVESCWIHHLGTNPGAHADGDQTRYGSNFVFRYNNIDMPYNVGPPYKSNAAFIVQTGAGPVDNFLVEENWLNGGNYTVYFTDKGVGYGNPTNCRMINNLFGRDYQFGTLFTSGYVFVSGNRWEDTLELMDINNN